MESPARTLIAVLAVIALFAVAITLRSNAENKAEATEQAGPARGTHYATVGCGDQVLKTPDQLTIPEAQDLTLCLLNVERRNAGLNSLGTDPLLEDAAEKHSSDMVARGYFEHDTPEGVTPQDRIGQALYKPAGGWTGENIAWGNGALVSPAAIVDDWMHSPGHRENILRPAFREVGVGIALGKAPRASANDELRAATYTTDFGG